MLSFLAGKARFCDGTTRREMLRVGGLSALGFWSGRFLDSPLRASETAEGKFGRAKSVVFVTLYGGPPQTETFDMKPLAPVEARGPFKPIRTSVSDTHICEHLPRLARLANLYTLARTFSHTNTAHGSSLYTHLTGWPHRVLNQNLPASPDDYPHYGALVSRLKPPQHRVPACAIVGGPILPQFDGIGQTGGFLGKVHSPFIVDKNPRPVLTPQHDIPTIRMQSRRQLLDRLQATARFLEQQRPAANFSTVQRRALKLLNSERFRAAFNLDQEPPKVRDTYGRFPLGQNLLQARRLVEAGVPVIQVSDIPPKGEQHWDLHYANIFSRLKDPLLPRLDQGVAAFLTDLHLRGLLDETLVIVGGEFGRTPWIDHLTDPPQGGRQHWPHCYSMLLAGGGIREGQVFGESDELAAYPVSHKVGPWDLGATLLHLMGIDPDSQVEDRRGRTRAICRGSVIRGLL